jgi:hypothetical protein
VPQGKGDTPYACDRLVPLPLDGAVIVVCGTLNMTEPWHPAVLRVYWKPRISWYDGAFGRIEIEQRL